MSIDDQVAENIMKWVTPIDDSGIPYDIWAREITENNMIVVKPGEFVAMPKQDWQPSTNILQALQVVNKLKERDYEITINVSPNHPAEVIIYAPILRANKYYKLGDDIIVREEAPEPAMAICLAALKTVGGY